MVTFCPAQPKSVSCGKPSAIHAPPLLPLPISMCDLTGSWKPPFLTSGLGWLWNQASDLVPSVCWQNHFPLCPGYSYNMHSDSPMVRGGPSSDYDRWVEMSLADPDHQGSLHSHRPRAEPLCIWGQSLKVDIQLGLWCDQNSFVMLKSQMSGHLYIVSSVTFYVWLFGR